MIATPESSSPPFFFSGSEHQPFVQGAGDAGAMLIHGFMGTPAEMRPLADRLAASGLTTEGILLPGFGPDVPRLPEMDRHAWLESATASWAAFRNKHEQAILVGFSMGAAIAVHLAARIPADALILIAPFWRLGSWYFNLIPLARRFVHSVAPFERADFDDPAVQKQLAAMSPGIDLSDPSTQQFLRQQVRLPLAVLDEVRLLGKEAYALAPQITSPVLIVQGNQDEVVRPQLTRRLVQRFGNQVQYVEIESDHSCVKLEKEADQIAEPDILRFLSATGVLGPEVARSDRPVAAG